MNFATISTEKLVVAEKSGHRMLKRYDIHLAQTCWCFYLDKILRPYESAMTDVTSITLYIFATISYFLVKMCK